jgi:hypothetical protein
MADSTTEIDLDSVIDRLLEGELVICTGHHNVEGDRGTTVSMAK